MSPSAPMRLAVLVSGSGTNLAALLSAVAQDPDFGGEVVVVASDRPDAGGLQRADDAGIATVVEPLADHPDRAAWETTLRRRIEEHRPDAVVLAGFMRILSGAFLSGWPDRVINTHPSILPAFRGAHAVRDALEHGVRLTGSTVHLVDEEVDHGPIIAQRAVEVREDDDETSLHERIKHVEHELLPACVKLLCQGRLEVAGRHVRVRPT
ncbi:MAG: phosphoribosylglycinamide formyltransferase [Nitriliruptor sp.]|uniref:phosphoribosylglycinamide formyltransferase n=1 Tax=Nitriliruptor sp. TaxID=2448056 RepID=UPI0034A0662E